MKVTVIPIIVGGFGMVHKDLEKKLRELEIRRRNKIIQTTALLKSSRIHKKIL